jgi:hypothetical protein
LPLKPGQAGEIVDEISHADLGAGADHADGAHDQPEAAFLCGKDMFDTGPYSRPSSMTEIMIGFERSVVAATSYSFGVSQRLGPPFSA